MKVYRRFESYILRMKVDIVQKTMAHFSGQKHSGNGICLKVALWVFGNEPRVRFLYNYEHIVCVLDGVLFDGGGIVSSRDKYRDVEGLGHCYFSRAFEWYLTQDEQLTLTRYFNMSLSKQIKDLERSIAERAQFISTKQSEIQETNASLQEARQQAQATLQEWQVKIDTQTNDLNALVQEITASHEAKLREEGRLGLLQEQFNQSGGVEAQEAPAN